MFSPIKDIAAADASVQSALGPGAARFYSFGEAIPGADEENGYAVWQLLPGSSPENLLAGRPQADVHINQVDVYCKNANTARAITRALVQAFELQGYVTWNGENREPDTKLFRISFTVDFITPR